MIDINAQIACWRAGAEEDWSAAKDLLDHGYPRQSLFMAHLALGPSKGSLRLIDQSVVASVGRYLSALRERGIPVTFGVVFGSQATGKAHAWSDIDVLVVSPRFDHTITVKDVDALWVLAAEIDPRIEPFPCGERQWREDDKSAVVEIARREGERIALPERV